MPKHSKDQPYFVFDIPGDFHLIAPLNITNEEEAGLYLDNCDKELLDLPPSKHTLAVSWRIKAGRDALRTKGLDSVMFHVGEIPHLRTAFIKEQRQNKARSKAGSLPKKAKGIMRQVEELLRDNPKMKTQEVWEWFPDGDPCEVTADGKRFEIYRDGNDDLSEYELDEKGKTVKQKTIKRRSFARYLTEARKNLNTPTQ